MKFSEYLIEQRLLNGFHTCTELSKFSGVSEAALSRIEAGLVTKPSLKTLRSLANVLLKTDSEELFRIAGVRYDGGSGDRYWKSKVLELESLLETTNAQLSQVLNVIDAIRETVELHSECLERASNG